MGPPAAHLSATRSCRALPTRFGPARIVALTALFLLAGALAACQPAAQVPQVIPSTTAVVQSANPLFVDQLTATATRVPTRVVPTATAAPATAAGSPAPPVSPSPSLLAAAPAARPRPPTVTPVPPPSGHRGYPAADLLVEPDWLDRNLANPKLRVVDARSPEAYAAGHVPGAINLGPEWLVDLGSQIPSQLLSADGFAAEMAVDGIGNDTDVVVYDDEGGLWASRIIWALHAYGHPQTRLLEGGIQAWRGAGKSVSTTPFSAPKAEFQPHPSEGAWASGHDVLAALDDPRAVIVDARSPEEYEGKLRLSARAGRIPGAKHRYWRENLGPGGQYFKPAAELKAAYQALGVTPDKRVIVYDQTGVAASHVYYTLRLLGYPDVRVYDDGWLEWGNNADLPVEREGS